MKYKISVPVIFGAILVSIMMGMVIGTHLERSVWYRQSIEHNYAEYNPKTGNWQWIEPEKKLDKPEN